VTPSELLVQKRVDCNVDEDTNADDDADEQDGDVNFIVFGRRWTSCSGSLVKEYVRAKEIIGSK
jgi:hypothetical protein